MELIAVDRRRRITLPKAATYDLYMSHIATDGTITLVPAVVRSVLEDRLRTVPGIIERLERNASDARGDVTFDDWLNPK